MDQKINQRVVSFRREIHQNPQSSFNQYQTRKRIRNILNQFGVKDECMVQMAKTGLVVDIKGQAQAQGENRCIAFRADMDALTMIQNNHHLEYRSKNEGVAHMCGHDGHMACLVGFVPLYMANLKRVPKNKTIRLLFQPSEEGPLSGAELMVAEKCLDGVDQVYGFHQWPTAPLGQLWCKQGPVMSEASVIKIKVIGQGGHGSEPQSIKVAIWEGMQLYMKIKNYIDQVKAQKKQAFVSTFPVFNAGQRYNVISDTAFMEGTIRSFQEGLKDKMNTQFQLFIEETKKKGFQVDYSFTTSAPINSNTKLEAEHVLRIGAQVFGKDKVGKGKLPFKASEDFSFFTKQKPGAFFFLSTAHDQPNPPMVHNSNFNFNDKLIPKAAQFWLKLALDRVGVKI